MNLLLWAVPIIILFCIAAYFDVKKHTIPNAIPALIFIIGILAIALSAWGNYQAYPSLFHRIIGFLIPFITTVYVKYKRNNIKLDYLKLMTSTGFFFGIFGLIYFGAVCTVVYAIYHVVTKKKTLPFATILAPAVFSFYVILFFLIFVIPY